MIGRNEPVSKKAKFWQSYVRSLKGQYFLIDPSFWSYDVHDAHFSPNLIWNLQDPRTSALTTASAPVAVSSQSWPAHGHTPSPSSTTRPMPLTASQCPDTVTCPSTGRLMATPRGPSTRTTTPPLWIGTGQVRTGQLGVEMLTWSLTHYMYRNVFVSVEICWYTCTRYWIFIGFSNFVISAETLR